MLYRSARFALAKGQRSLADGDSLQRCSDNICQWLLSESDRSAGLTCSQRTQYGITNVAVAGCLYIANGGGNFVGARIGGRK